MEKESGLIGLYGKKAVWKLILIERSWFMRVWEWWVWEKGKGLEDLMKE